MNYEILLNINRKTTPEVPAEEKNRFTGLPAEKNHPVDESLIYSPDRMPMIFSWIIPVFSWVFFVAGKTVRYFDL